ncbi:MAG: PilZ domain-containing protein [Candidatus Omnitrophica bacterium]|nr:PilZ domain-containing protein [Candidatus Omnitrophota bacterium]
MNKYGGPERRNFPRLNANFVVSYRVKEVPEGYDLSQTKNVGQGGILLTTNRKFENGTHLAMSIRFPFIAKRIEVTGAVVDSKEIVRDLIYETRIQFLDLDTEFFQKLGEFVKEHLK